METYVGETERAGFDQARAAKILNEAYLQLKSGGFNDLARLEDVLSLHGFLPSRDSE